MNTHVSHSPIVVRYCETDQMGVAWHGNYIQWYEVGRTDWLREQGTTYLSLEQSGLLLPVLRIDCHYMKASRYDDVLDVETRLAEYNGLRLVFSYTVRRSGEAVILAQGESEHVFSRPNLRPLRLQKSAPALHRLLAGETNAATAADPAPGSTHP